MIDIVGIFLFEAVLAALLWAFGRGDHAPKAQPSRRRRSRAVWDWRIHNGKERHPPIVCNMYSLKSMGFGAGAGTRRRLRHVRVALARADGTCSSMTMSDSAERWRTSRAISRPTAARLSR